MKTLDTVHLLRTRRFFPKRRGGGCQSTIFLAFCSCAHPAHLARMIPLTPSQRFHKVRSKCLDLIVVLSKYLDSFAVPRYSLGLSVHRGGSRNPHAHNSHRDSA